MTTVGDRHLPKIPIFDMEARHRASAGSDEGEDTRPGSKYGLLKKTMYKCYKKYRLLMGETPYKKVP